MTSRSTQRLWRGGRSWLANALAVGRMAGHVLTGPVFVRHRREWGATTYETVEDLPGDEVLSPSWQATRAVTVAVPPERVWPWLVQLGQGRGGFYTFERLENVIGCRIRNAESIEPQWQSLATGDEVRLHPNMPGLLVSVLDAPRDLVLVGRPRGGSVGIVWSFHLRPHPDGCRLVERTRMVYGAACLGRLGGSEWLVGSIAHVMSTGMLRNIKALAERSEITPGPGVAADHGSAVVSGEPLASNEPVGSTETVIEGSVVPVEREPSVAGQPAVGEPALNELAVDELAVGDGAISDRAASDVPLDSIAPPDSPAPAREEPVTPADAPAHGDATTALPLATETGRSGVVPDSRQPDSGAPTAAEPAMTPPYQRHTKAALYDEARRRNIKGRSAMSKPALVAALEEDDRQ